MERKLIVFMNESGIHKSILDHSLAESDEIYHSLDDKIIKSHCETKKAIDNVINNNIVELHFENDRIKVIEK